MLALFLFFIAWPAIAQTANTGQQNGKRFIPYDPPNEQQIKFELLYSDVESPSGSGGKVNWKNVIIKNFAVTGGDPVMTAETPDCTSTMRMDEITSTNRLKLHANKGALFLEGVGFMFHHTNMDLIVSNQTHSILYLRSTTNSLSPPTEIFSHHGEFKMPPDATNGMALYIGNVHVLDPQMKLDCEWLKADLPKNESGQTNRPNHIVARTNVVIDFMNTNGDQVHALGSQAIYDYRVGNAATNETLELTGNPRVSMTNGWMTADVFVMDRTTGKLNGRGNFHFHYHPSTQPAETEIVSDAFDYDGKTRIANFYGHVRANDVRMKLRSEFLTALLPQHDTGAGNHLQHGIAETNVVIDFVSTNSTNLQTIHATGQKAVYDYKLAGGVTNELLELTGNPSVQQEKGWMTAEVIKLDNAQGLVWGTGSHHSVIKKQPGDPATMDTEIYSDTFEYANATGVATYRGHVRAYDPEINLSQAQSLVVEFTKRESGGTNIHMIVAEGNVVLDFAGKPFGPNDITNLPAFAKCLKEPTNGVSKFVASQLSPATKSVLASYTNGPNALLKQLLADDLNNITQSSPVYEPSRFENVYVSLDASQLMKRDPMGLDLIQLNRLLLVDAFRGMLARGKNGEVTHATGERAIYTNQGKDATATALLKLYGHPILINPTVWIEADESVTYDRLTRVAHAVGNPHIYPNIANFSKAKTPAEKGKR